MSARIARWISLGAAGSACLFLYLGRTAQAPPEPAEPPDNIAQFRLKVGLTDQQPREWQGSITVEGGELAGISGWRFSQQDRAGPDGRFQFRTKIGQLENQLLPGHPYGQTDWADPNMKRLIPEGLLVRVRAGARVKFDSDAGSFGFVPSEVPLGKTLLALEGNASIERLPLERRLSEAGTADDYPAAAIASNGQLWTVWLSYEKDADIVVASGGGSLHRLTERGDHHAPAIADDGNGRIWVVWSQIDGGVFQLYARSFDGRSWSKAEPLTRGAGSNLSPALASDGQGRLAVVWQGFRKDQAVILARRRERGHWTPELQVSQGPGNCWAPAAAWDGSKLSVAWDSYATGSYQIYIRQNAGAVERVTRGANFSVRPSLTIQRGHPVIAWEESDPLWGKDFAYLSDRRGTTLYKNRRIRLAFREGGSWKPLAALPEESMPAGLRRYLQQPQLAADAEGRLYLAFRTRTSATTARIDNWASGGRWETFLTFLDQTRWAPAIPMPSSVGRNGMRSALALKGGRAQVVWAADNRVWPAVKYRDLDVFTATVPANAPPARLIAGSWPDAGPANPNPRETADTRQIRDYRLSLNGKQYRILRGDLHRHTELSGDGAGDGSLDDLYRYTLDAAAMDYAHVADHQMGNDEEYNWWITQKSNDLYYMPQRFVPLYGYERSVWWPNGHRNVIWAERGKPVLRIGPDERDGKVNSGPILYPYLRETNGIATPHSSATEQGTDWRDNDPQLEPMVEIYQGFESSYEHPGAPRSWKPGEAKVHQGERPAGYIWNAWAKGYKLGVQSSSDHVSTHASYACILVEEFTRQGLLDAMRKRHTYAATDQIVLDYRISTPDGAGLLMGDIGTTSGPPKLRVKVLGTGRIRQIDVIKNNAYIHKVSPGEKTAAFEYVDNAPAAGESYYYVRVEQTDGQLAWSSPIWLRYTAR